INELVEGINSNLPSREEVYNKYKAYDNDFDQRDLNKYFLNNTLAILEKPDNYSLDIEKLIYATNVAVVGVGSIDFKDEIKVIENQYKWFASFNDVFKIAFDDNGVIYIGTEEFSDFEIFAKNSDIFFHFLILYSEYERAVIWQNGLGVEGLK